MHRIESPVDSHPTDQLLSLYSHLRRLTGKKIMLGHQDTTLCRRMHECDSDVVTLTGAYPAVWGFDLGRIELGWKKNIDDVSFDQIRQQVLRAHDTGAIPTITWHSVNPITSGGYGSNLAPDSVRAVLPGGDRHGRFLDWLDRVAIVLSSLTDEDNIPIPVIFRPFHEHNGTWFWWSLGSPMEGIDTSEDEFRQLWRMSVDYLRNSCGIHHVLYAYSPDRSRIDLTDETAMTGGYLYGYPGDDYVDVLGIDLQTKVHQSNMRILLLCSPWSDISPKSGESWQLLRKSVRQELSPQDSTMEETGKKYAFLVLGQAICFLLWKRTSSLLECYGASHGVIPWKRREQALMEPLLLILPTHKILLILHKTSASFLLKS